MSKTICISQSNYIPWRGYFDLIRKSDEYIIFDGVQYSCKDWRNRNKIKTRNGLQWLTIPVESAGRLKRGQQIDETRVVDGRWVGKHLKSLHHAYHNAPSFDGVMTWLGPLYKEIADEPLLTVINERLLRAICAELRIRDPAASCRWLCRCFRNGRRTPDRPDHPPVPRGRSDALSFRPRCQGLS